MNAKHRNSIAAATLMLAACGAPAPQPGLEFTPGQTRSPILGGGVDEHRSFVVAISDGETVFCTGTLIASDVVLTAAHCGTKYTLESVRLDTDAGQLQIPITDTRRHPNYGGAFAEHDLQLLRLAAPAPVGPAPLLRETMDNGERYVGPDFTFVGYGRSAPGAAAGVRRSVSFPIKSVGSGTYTYDGQLGLVDVTQFYYESDDAGPCPGDSGAAALLAIDGVEYLAGTGSRASPSCSGVALAARSDQPAIDDFIQPGLDQWSDGDECAPDGSCAAGCTSDGKLIDPDCSAYHCGEDGICAQACGEPLDPDCATAPAAAPAPSTGEHNACSAAAPNRQSTAGLLVLLLCPLLRRRRIRA